MRRIGLAAVMVLVAGLGCIVHQQRLPYPLYPYPHFHPRSAEELAVLQGPIVAKVDDEDVSQHGEVFSLLPGCHVVELKTEFGESGRNGFSSQLSRRIYAIRMQATHRYVIEIDAEHMTGPLGRLEIKMVDNPPEGKPTPEWPIKSEADIEKCRAWVPAPDDT